MRLSEAIRLGAMTKPQAFGALVDDDGGTCAYGAALDAIGVLYSFCDGPDEWYATGAFGAVCPVCHDRKRESNVFNTLAHLNDDHRWSREQIADWVETIEQQHDAKLIETPQEQEAVLS